MSHRTKEIYKLIQSELDLLIIDILQEMKEQYQSNKIEILKLLNTYFLNCYKNINKFFYKKGQIKYIQVSYLLSSLTKVNLEFKIDYYNQDSLSKKSLLSDFFVIMKQGDKDARKRI